MARPYNPLNRKFDIKNWGFRKSYPTGIKMTDDVHMMCTKCGLVYGRGRPLPIQLKDGQFDYCVHMSGGKRCMNREYEVFQKIELEAMPIGRVVLPSGRQGTWTHRGK